MFIYLKKEINALNRKNNDKEIIYDNRNGSAI